MGRRRRSLRGFGIGELGRRFRRSRDENSAENSNVPEVESRKSRNSIEWKELFPVLSSIHEFETRHSKLLISPSPADKIIRPIHAELRKIRVDFLNYNIFRLLNSIP